MTDSRVSVDGVRRRRICNQCKRRFTTYERVSAPPLKVQKRDGSTEPFDPNKLTRVIERVSRDREAIQPADALRLARRIEAQLIDEHVKTIRTSELVDRLLTLLASLDPVAHARLAANYVAEDGILRTNADKPAPGETKQLALFEPEES